jgi:predicted RNA methylase
MQPMVLWHKVYSWCCELCLRLDTRGAVQPLTDEGVHYTPLPYPLIARMLRVLDLRSSDVFVDVGCGKGRVVCCACRLLVKRVVALELNRELLDQAMENARRVRGRRAPVEPVGISADEYEFSDATVVYLYNPFNARITGLVMEQLYRSYLQAPRTIRVVYANPVHESVLTQRGWLEKYAEWPPDDFPVFGYRVSFWRTLAPAGGTLQKSSASQSRV